MATEAQRRAVKKYDAANTVQFHLKLNVNTDAAIIEKLKSVEKVQTYLKELIAADIKRGDIGRWVPGRLGYVKDTWEGTEYERPVWVPDESIESPSVVVCPFCGACVGADDAGEYCGECRHKMHPFNPQKWADS